MMSSASALDSSPRRTSAYVWLWLLLLLAGAAQATLSHRLWFWGGQPDFILAVVLAAAVLSDAGAGCVIGLGGGLLTGAVVGETVGTYLVTRTVAGFVAGLLPSRMFRANIFVIVSSAVAASVVAETLYILAAPRIGLSQWLPAALAGMLWNALLAVPAAFFLRRVGWSQGRHL